MEQLLNDMLQNPGGQAMDLIEQRIDTVDGQKELLALLEAGNGMVFAYIKMRCKEWIEQPARIRMLHVFKENLFALIFSCSETNFAILNSFLETLYLHNCAWEDLVPLLCARPGERSMRVMDHLFNKYRTSPRSDSLYTEIIRNIELTQDLFSRAYFEAESVDRSLLRMFYSLTCQDIHPFFEKNVDRFFNAFCILFRSKELQQDICEIFNLFISKYPECVDVTRVLGALLTNITAFEYLKYSVLLNVVKRKNYQALVKFSAALANAVRMGACISETEMEEMKRDTLLYSANLLRGYDVNRGLVVEIVGHLRKVLGEEWIGSLVSFEISTPMDEERLIFLCIALRLVTEDMTRRCIAIVRNSGAGHLGVVAFRYLLLLDEYTEIDLGYVSRDHPASFLAIAYLTRHIETCRMPLKAYSLCGKRYSSAMDDAGGLEYHRGIMNKLVYFLRGDIEDEFSSKLVQRIVRTDTRVATPEVVAFLQEYTESNVRNINSPQAYVLLLDVQGIIFLSTGDSSYALGLVQTILAEEIFEAYLSAFFLLAVIVLCSAGSFSSVMDIIKQETLWKTKELLPGLVCLSIALFRTGHCGREQMRYIVTYLSGISEHHACLVLNAMSEDGRRDDVEEAFVLATTLHQNGLLDAEAYADVYSRSTAYFLENFISKKNVRRVLRALQPGDRAVVEEKNRHNMGHENMPFSAIVAFGL